MANGSKTIWNKEYFQFTSAESVINNCHSNKNNKIRIDPLIEEDGIKKFV